MTSGTSLTATVMPTTRVRVLVVDDHPINVKLVVALLEHAGLEVRVARSGAEAVAHAAEGGFAIVLMDVHMPGMDGYEATRRIRTLPDPAGSVPIIALTADVPESAEPLALQAGMAGVCAKPIRIPELLEMIACHAVGDFRRHSTP